MTRSDDVIVDAQHVSRVFQMPAGPVTAVRDVSLQIAAGDHIAVRGPSGCGKSTLLHIVGCLDRPTSGSYSFNGVDVARLSDQQRAGLRSRGIGFVFQSFHLLPRLTALGNVALPLVYRGVPRHERLERAAGALAAVGLADRTAHRPNQLSGGQQQRVAMARAIVGDPQLILADEPTGNLDTTTGDEVMGMLRALHEERGTTLVVVTHEARIAARADRRIRVVDGRVEEAP